MTPLILAALSPIACVDAPVSDSSSAVDCPEAAASACPDGVTITSDSSRTLAAPIVVPHGPISIRAGDLEGTGNAQIYVGTQTTVTRLDGENWATATDIWAQPGDGGGIFPLVADLTADGIVDLAIGLPGSDDGAGQVIVFPGPISGALDWNSPHIELQGTDGAGAGLDVGDFDGDGTNDLFVRGTDTAWVKFGPMLADDPLGGESDTEFSAADGIGASGAIVVDLDADAVSDLLFFEGTEPVDACDEYPWVAAFANGPFEAGRFVTWGVRPLTNPTDALLVPPHSQSQTLWPVDLDGDGFPEIVGSALSTSPTREFHGVVYQGPIAGGAAPSQRFAASSDVAGIGDFNGDEIPDLLQAGSVSTSPTVLSGPVSALPSPDAEPCAVHTDEVWPTAEGADAIAATWVGNLDDDAISDVVMAQTGALDEGLVYVVLGGL